jgi:hypothetical protein
MEIDVWAVIPEERMGHLPTPPARLEWRDARNKAAGSTSGKRAVAKKAVAKRNTGKGRSA